ncbi:hypothetical protein OC842_006839 [Tilletia horrida]|uniref:Uncharacterized protein n=1 Tax=Tilletia horrida TaxID=155126 RepID=A0AAN6JH88_9BASI|nr:hypothetical protein OC842_006839 [Tilletia horrida]
MSVRKRAQRKPAPQNFSGTLATGLAVTAIAAACVSLTIHLDRLNPPALNRASGLKMAHELVTRSCYTSVCAFMYCTNSRIIVANETTRPVQSHELAARK